MADIKQAAKWMQEGKVVMRASRPTPMIAGALKWIRYRNNPKPVIFTPEWLLADDYEIVEPEES